MLDGTQITSKKRVYDANGNVTWATKMGAVFKLSHDVFDQLVLVDDDVVPPISQADSKRVMRLRL